jgi:CubicO group peptidase (beta-lactamase class C family)
VRDLLGHTAGIGDPPEAFWRQVLRHPRRRVTTRPFIAATPRPGPRTSEAAYSTAGFLITGIILESAAREPLAAVMRRELLSAAGGDGLAIQPAERPRVLSPASLRQMTDFHSSPYSTGMDSV